RKCTDYLCRPGKLDWLLQVNHKQEIRAAEIRLLYEQLPSAQTATIVNAAILIAVLWRQIPHLFLIGWLLFIVLVVCGRYALRRSYMRQSVGSEASHPWGRQYLYGVVANGLLWGVAGYFFFTPPSYVHQV